VSVNVTGTHKTGKLDPIKLATSEGDEMAPRKNATVVMGPESANLKVIDTVTADPSKLHFRDSNLLGRSRPVSDEDVIALADSMNVAVGGTGQQQPLQVRPMHTEGEYEIIFGNTRARAGQLIKQGYKGNDGKDRPAQPNFTLRCEVVEADDKTAFMRVVVENAHRNQTSPIDDALNQQILRDTYQMTDVKIAQLYGVKSSASVFRLKKLLTLPQIMQDYIHDGRMTFQAGSEIQQFGEKHGPEALGKVWDNIKKPSENETDPEKLGSTRISLSDVQDAVKAWKEEQKTAAKNAPQATTGEQGSQPAPGDTTNVPPAGEGTTTHSDTSVNGTPKEKDKALTAPKIKKILTDLTTATKNVPQVFKDFAAAFLMVCEGTASTRDLADFMQHYASAAEIAQWDMVAEKEIEEAAKPEEQAVEA